MRTFPRVIWAAAIGATNVLSGCGDPLSPDEFTAKRLDALAAGLNDAQQERQSLLRIASHTIRRGAPVNRIAITVDGTQRTFDAVAIQIGFLGTTDTTGLVSHLIAWRGENAQDLLRIYAEGTALYFPDPSTAYIGNLGATSACPVTNAAYVCERRQVDIEFAITTAVYVTTNGVAVDHTLSMSKTRMRGIRYLGRCPATEIGCTISMIEDFNR